MILYLKGHEEKSQEVQQDLDYPNSSGDCSIRVFCQLVYVLLEYFNRALYDYDVIWVEA